MYIDFVIVQIRDQWECSHKWSFTSFMRAFSFSFSRIKRHNSGNTIKGYINAQSHRSNFPVNTSSNFSNAPCIGKEHRYSTIIRPPNPGYPLRDLSMVATFSALALSSLESRLRSINPNDVRTIDISLNSALSYLHHRPFLWGDEDFRGEPFRDQVDGFVWSFTREKSEIFRATVSNPRSSLSLSLSGLLYGFVIRKLPDTIDSRR